MTTSSIEHCVILAVNDTTSVKYFTLYREEDKIKYAETNRFEDMLHNPIEEAYDKLLTAWAARHKAIGSGPRRAKPKEISL